MVRDRRACVHGEPNTPVPLDYVDNRIHSRAFDLVLCDVFTVLLDFFRGIDLQDEARIASLLRANEYLIAGIVRTTLSLILWKCSRIMKLDVTAVGYLTVLGVSAILLVTGVNRLLF